MIKRKGENNTIYFPFSFNFVSSKIRWSDFKYDLIDYEYIKNKIYLLAKHVSQRATKRTMIGNVIYVTFKNANRKCFTKQQIIKKYTNFLDDIYSVAIILFEQFWSGQPIRLIGVGLRGIIRGIISKYDLKEQLSFESLGTLQPDTVTNKLTNKIYSISFITNLFFSWLCSKLNCCSPPPLARSTKPYACLPKMISNVVISVNSAKTLIVWIPISFKRWVACLIDR
ncbi:DinB/UmuC family translesion DNA polymerase [Spiroplasma citri]|uniref:DinB/UmuC family translesion DNA polymerase n=1 Tax=Spiroplasma citri TaxID=2133 RepID=UPI00286EFEED|nr:hypothetical protein [Spiroplasma citri]